MLTGKYQLFEKKRNILTLKLWRGYGDLPEGFFCLKALNIFQSYKGPYSDFI
jgi:hypothetical protein